MSRPELTIYLCSGLRLNSRYDHSIYFATASAQQAYFRGKVVKTLPAYSFIRRSWTLKVEGDLTEAVKWNYLYFLYPNDSKFYYYFINKVEYVNDETVELTLELDLLQTYLFDVSFSKCMIEREHVTNDTFGRHTVDEGLDAGEYVYAKWKVLEELTEYVIMILASFNPYTTTNANNANTTGGIYGGVYSGLGLYAVPLDKSARLTEKIDALSEEGLTDGIVSMWVYPKALVTLQGDQTWESDMWCFNVDDVDAYGTIFNPVKVIEPNLAGTEYTPKNNKVLCYPYNIIEVNNNSGSKVIYRIEHFNNNNSLGFWVEGALTPDAGMRLMPDDYLRGSLETGNNHAINLPSFPTCAWNSDTYKIWLAQNQHTIEAGAASGTIGAIAGMASIIGGAAMIATGAGAGVGAGMIGGGAVSVAHSLVQVKSTIASQDAAEKQADQMRGSFSPSINATMGMHTFTIAQKQITKERAKIIDDYFTTYGYKVNRIDTPSRHNRESFTYVKTIGCHVYGEITDEDAVKIESIYDKGVTWWVNGDQIGDYSVSNSTI